MKSFVLAAAAFVSLAAAQSTPIVNTPPSLVQCQPALITFSGGSAPYYLSILPAGQVAATPIEYLPDQAAAGSYTWTVNLPAGTNITISIRDGAGQLNYAAPLVIQTGPTSSCLGTSAASSASAASTTTAAAVSSLATTSAASTGTVITSAASATVTAASGVPTGGVNGTSSTYNLTCSQGLLTYGITIADLANVTLREATSYFANWTNTAPGALLNATGRGVGATRAYSLAANITIEETLRLNTTNRTTGALHQQWNFTSPTPVEFTPTLTAYNAFDDLTVYRNDSTGTTQLQYFILACFNDQASGISLIASFVEQAVSSWAAQIAGANSSSTSSAATLGRRVVQLY